RDHATSVVCVAWATWTQASLSSLLYVAVDDAGFQYIISISFNGRPTDRLTLRSRLPNGSLVFPFGKFHGGYKINRLFSVLVSVIILTKSLNVNKAGLKQKESQLHEFRSKLSILVVHKKISNNLYYVIIYHFNPVVLHNLNWHKIILQTKYSITKIKKVILHFMLGFFIA
ncbi:hypothetical protein ACJX0J_009786, partial [Zea mays]